jgi:hypothetical protein
VVAELHRTRTSDAGVDIRHVPVVSVMPIQGQRETHRETSGSCCRSFSCCRPRSAISGCTRTAYGM